MSVFVQTDHAAHSETPYEAHSETPYEARSFIY